MKIYIASSWRNQHGVEMLTALLRERGHEVLSFVENNHDENPDAAINHDKAVDAIVKNKEFNFDEWVWSENGTHSFKYDSEGAMYADLVIYYGPSGKDAAAECGMAFSQSVPIIGLQAKGEDFGLMRRMMDGWVTRYTDLLKLVDGMESGK